MYDLAFAARVVKLVDTRDLKSLGRNAVPVRVRPRAPSEYQSLNAEKCWGFFFESFWIRKFVIDVQKK